MKTFFKGAISFWIVHTISNLTTYLFVQNCIKYPISWQIGSGWRLFEYHIGNSNISICIIPFFSHPVNLLHNNLFVDMIAIFMPIVACLVFLILYLSVWYNSIVYSTEKVLSYFVKAVIGVYQGMLFRQIYEKYTYIKQNQKAMNYGKNLILPNLTRDIFSEELSSNEKIFFKCALLFFAIQLLPLPYTSLGDMIVVGLTHLNYSKVAEYGLNVAGTCVAVAWIFTSGLIFDLYLLERKILNNEDEEDLKLKVRMIMVAEMLRFKTQLLLQQSPYSMKYDYIFAVIAQNNLNENIQAQTQQNGREPSEKDVAFLTDLYIGQKNEVIKRFHYDSWGIHDN